MTNHYEIRKLDRHCYTVNGERLDLNPLDLAHHIMGLERQYVSAERAQLVTHTAIRAAQLATSFGGSCLRHDRDRWVVDPLREGEAPLEPLGKPRFSPQQLANAAVGKIHRGPRPSAETRPSPTATAKVIAFPPKKP